MASNISVTPVTSGGAGPPTTTILSQAQATQLIQKLRAAGGAGGLDGTTGAIKIQAVQTNPQTGVRQIIAIPIQASSATTSTSKISVSPLKAKPPMQTIGGATPPVVSGTTASLGPNVKVVKLASFPDTHVKTSTAHVVNHAQVITPSKQNQQGNASFMSPLMDSGSKKRADIDFDAFSDSKRRKTEKGGKGLRHFSMKVCEKVQAKGSTSYNEVADELVAELTDPRCSSPTDQQYDQKNIRRRVYDALNVLMAMNIISKEKKEIRWLGLPTNSVQEANSLEVDKAKRMERIKAKTQQLQDLILQQIAFKNLVERNKEREKVEGAPTPNSAIQLPFIIVNTSKKTVIDCSISNDKMEYLFNFDDTFEIHDDMEVLKRMGLSFGLEKGSVSQEDLSKARQMVPRALEQYVIQLAENGPGNCVGMPKVTDPIVLKQQQSREEGGQEAEEFDSDVDIS